MSDRDAFCDPCRGLSQRSASEKTIAGLARARAAGVRLGRPRRCPDEVLAKVVSWRVSGASLREIAGLLNSEGVETPGGASTWYASYVLRLLRTQDARELLYITVADSRIVSGS